VDTSALTRAHAAIGPAASDATLLPDEPLVRIRPGATRRLLDLHDLGPYRELLYFLTWRDVKVRYKQAFLGMAWVVVQPVLMTVIFTVFLGVLARVPSERRVPYPLFAYVGLLPWTFFSSAIQSSATSVVNNTHLITKVYFPRLIVPAAAVAARLVDFGVGFVVLIGLMILYGVTPTWHAAALPLLILLTVLLALGVGLSISALNVKYRDVGIIVPVAVQLWMFVSPVLYPTSLVPERWHSLYALNPLVGIIDGFRAAIFGRPFDWCALLSSTVITALVVVQGLYLFRRTEMSFADAI
jgi:homopolymeric O-antigen transport system permease protein